MLVYGKYTLWLSVGIIKIKIKSKWIRLPHLLSTTFQFNMLILLLKLKASAINQRYYWWCVLLSLSSHTSTSSSSSSLTTTTTIIISSKHIEWSLYIMRTLFFSLSVKCNLIFSIFIFSLISNFYQLLKETDITVYCIGKVVSECMA